MSTNNTEHCPLSVKAALVFVSPEEAFPEEANAASVCVAVCQGTRTAGPPTAVNLK